MKKEAFKVLEKWSWTEVNKCAIDAKGGQNLFCCTKHYHTVCEFMDCAIYCIKHGITQIAFLQVVYHVLLPLPCHVEVWDITVIVDFILGRLECIHSTNFFFSDQLCTSSSESTWFVAEIAETPTIIILHANRTCCCFCSPVECVLPSTRSMAKHRDQGTFSAKKGKVELASWARF